MKHNGDSMGWGIILLLFLIGGVFYLAGFNDGRKSQYRNPSYPGPIHSTTR